jgi:hypothetical protein
MQRGGNFTSLIPFRERTGSAENPITKPFPARITEERFLETLDELHATRSSIDYSDDRDTGHTLKDFTLCEHGLELPINIKNAGTRFERAKQLVGLDPDDCIPIPAYKAFAAIESVPNLIYVVSVDYHLIGTLQRVLPQLFRPEEAIVWHLLNKHVGTHVKNAEDTFISAVIRKHWTQLKEICKNNPFYVISARKSVRILQTKPQRTPGVGLRAWGTGANAEVNVHISISEEMTPWKAIRDRILQLGLEDIVRAVNRKRVEEVYDPEI